MRERRRTILLWLLFCSFIVFAMTILWGMPAEARDLNVHVSRSITAENQWSDPLTVPLGKTVICGVDANSNSNMTITVQIQFRDEFVAAPSTWNYDVNSWVINGLPDEVNGLPKFSEWVRLRIGCKTGDYTSGNCTAVRMSRGAR